MNNCFTKVEMKKNTASDEGVKAAEAMDVGAPELNKPVDVKTEAGELKEDKNIAKKPEKVEDFSFINPMDGEITINKSSNWIVDNFLARGSTILIKAESGVGLTWLLSALALGVARRTVEAGDKKKTEAREFVFSHFRTSQPVDVTYCDGSLTAKTVAERLMALKDKELNIDCKINLLCRNGKDLSFYNEETRVRLASNLRGDDGHLVIFDSLSTLFGVDKESLKKPEGTPCFEILSWLKELRNRNVTMIFVVSEGIERDMLRLPSSFIDVAIKLSRVPNYTATEMRVEFLKSRNLDKRASIPFRLSLESSENGDGKVNLVYKDDPNFYICRVHELTQQGIPQTKIARELGCNQSTVSRWLARSLPEQPRIR